MNSLTEFFNLWGSRAVEFAWPMFWQSSLLAAALLAVDFVFRKKIRPATMHMLWMILLVKLVLPPSLALPTGVGWWVRSVPHTRTMPASPSAIVTFGANAYDLSINLPVSAPPAPTLSPSAWALICVVAVYSFLLGWMLLRSRAVSACIRGSTKPPEWLSTLLEEARRHAGVRQPVGLKVFSHANSPALCGLLHPTITIPQTLLDRLTPSQVRAVLLHELLHLRRGDVWINSIQTLIQIAYWWHPLVWIANARIRQVREEAVDEAVMVCLHEESEGYPSTLLEVAKMALARPMTSLGFVEILESRRALKNRIRRLLDFRPPAQSKVSVGSVLLVLALGAFAVPMGQAPKTTPPPRQVATVTEPAPASQDSQQMAQVRRLYEAGLLNEADKLVKDVIRQNPSNEAAHYYANLIREARQTQKNSPAISKGRKAIIDKLQSIQVDEIDLRNLTLGEAAIKLASVSKRLDPEKRGINFLVSSSWEGDPGYLDKTNDLSQVRIGVQVPLHDLRLSQVLEALVMSSEKPVRYRIEDYAVIFTAGQTGVSAVKSGLLTRSYKFDDNMLESLAVHLGAEPDLRANPKALIRKFFESTGLTLSPPRTWFYNDRQQVLFVRGTEEDIKVMSATVASLSSQLNIKVKFIEVPLALSQSLESVLANDPNGPASTEEIGTLGGILQASQALELLKKIEMIPGQSTIQGSVTTLSGRQSEIAFSNPVTNVNAKALTPPGISREAEARGELYVAEPFAMGPSIRLLPLQQSGGRQIQLSTQVTIRKPASPSIIKQFTVYVDGIPKSVSLPDPTLCTVEGRASAVLPDGDSMVVLMSRTAAQKASGSGKQVLVIITPAVVTPTGERFYKD